ESIDENTAILLYDNGYKTVEMIEETDLKDLTKIKGLKKKIAKNIKTELDRKKNEESFEVETIVVGETVEGDVSEDEIESKEQDEILEREMKIEAFEEVESIDENTAILLYDNGITTVEMLKEASIKELGKIKGLKKKTVKNIKKELEKEEEIEEKILTHEPVESEEGFFEEKEEIEDIPPLKEEKDDVFKDIKSIDEQIAKLLKKNGINSIKALKGKTIKELTKIRGIKKKLAKEIKQDVNALVKKIDDDNAKNESYDRDSNPFIDEDEDDGWESLDEEKKPESVVEEAKEFRHGEYTLYEKEIVTKSGKKQKVRFFSKGKPDEGEPIGLPDDYEVRENKKTGVPYLRKKK
ncbi:MAG: helix-hairpin-helix domain-containing protein, partial [Thermoplasmatales archaeon]|nr:helix-hairpin-helix domain-containing protein [Thermoplasmatales archaeon]